MSKFSTLLLSVIFIIGMTLSLMQLYFSTDEIQYPFMASLYYLATSFVIGFLFVKLNLGISLKDFLYK